MARACNRKSDCLRLWTAARTTLAGAAHPSAPSSGNVIATDAMGEMLSGRQARTVSNRNSHGSDRNKSAVDSMMPIRPIRRRIQRSRRAAQLPDMTAAPRRAPAAGIRGFHTASARADRVRERRYPEGTAPTAGNRSIREIEFRNWPAPKAPAQWQQAPSRSESRPPISGLETVCSSAFVRVPLPLKTLRKSSLRRWLPARSAWSDSPEGAGPEPSPPATRAFPSRVRRR